MNEVSWRDLTLVICFLSSLKERSSVQLYVSCWLFFFFFIGKYLSVLMLQVVIDAALLNRQNLEMENLVIKQGIITNDFSYV